jgi:hypothetical protein
MTDKEPRVDIAPIRERSSVNRRYVVVVTSRCRAVVEVEAGSRAEARTKARRLDTVGQGFDGWEVVTRPLHVEAGPATLVGGDE